MQPYEIFNDVLSSKKNVQIKLLGDSITHGVGGTGFSQSGYSFIKGYARNPYGYCWANVFSDYMEDNFQCTVINNASTGTNIQFIINNFDTLVDKEDDIIICTIGTNNRHFLFTNGDKPAREEYGKQFYDNVLKLYSMFKDSGKPVIFVANIPASAENEQDGDYYWRVLHMDDINAIYKKAAEKVGFPLISMCDLFINHCKSKNITIDSLLVDDLHPNNRGYKVICDLLIKELRLN